MRPSFSLQDLQRICSGALASPSSRTLPPPPTPAPRGPITTDTRALQPGQWFLALNGSNFDGHDFLQTAVSRGAAGCIVSRQSAEGPGAAALSLPVPLIAVPDTLRALQDLASSVRDNFSGPVVGITGSVGKTSTKDLTALALSPLGHVHKTDGNKNNLIGLPLTLLDTPEGSKVIVLEMGMDRFGELLRLAEIARPSIRLITNVGPVHLKGCGGTIEGVAAAKGELFRGATLSDTDTLVVNMDDTWTRRIAAEAAAAHAPRGVRAVTYGSGEGNDVVLAGAKAVEGGRRTLVIVRDNAGGSGVHEVLIQSPGELWGPNVAAVLAAGLAAGVPMAAAARALSDFRPGAMRMQIRECSDGTTVIEDMYNANPISMDAAIDAAAALAAGGGGAGPAGSTGGPRRLVLCLGDMLDLGGSSAGYHDLLLERASHVAPVLLLCGQEMVSSCERAGLGGRQLASPREDSGWRGRGRPLVQAFQDARALAEEIQQLVCRGDVVLIKGSRGIGMEAVAETLR